MLALFSPDLFDLRIQQYSSRGLVDQPYEEMVAAFMARFLDVDLARVTGRIPGGHVSGRTHVGWLMGSVMNLGMANVEYSMYATCIYIYIYVYSIEMMI